MFALFFSLYYAMFTGSWISWNINEIAVLCKSGFNSLSLLVTSIFGDFQYSDFGNAMLSPVGQANAYTYISLISFILALITSIGIVVMAVKGIKRIFSVFFYGVR